MRGHPLAPGLGTVIALVGDALAVAIDPMPRIETSDGPLLHIETAPAAIRTAGSPNVVAVPTRSIWQHDCIALRLIMPVSGRCAPAAAWPGSRAQVGDARCLGIPTSRNGSPSQSARVLEQLDAHRPTSPPASM